MKDVLSNYLKIMKIKDISFLLTTYEGKIVDKYVMSSEAIKNIDGAKQIVSLFENINIKKRIGKDRIFTQNGFTFFDFPVYHKIVIFDEEEIKPDTINDLYFITELLNGIAESVVLLDKSNKILYTNDIFSNRYGFSENNIIGAHFSEILPPEYLEDVISGIKTEQKKDFVVELYDKMGETNSAKMHLVLWDTVTIVIIYDIKEKEGWSKQIEGLKRMQDMIFDSIAQGIIVIDKEGSVIKFNRFMQDKYMFSREDVIGRNIFELFPDLLKLKIDKAFAEVIEGKKSKKILGVKRYSKRMKKELIQNLYGYPIVEAGRAVGAVILIDDITEKKMLEAEYEMVQKKSEIVNELNSILSENIEIESLILNVSKYLFEHVKYSKCFLYNNINNILFEYNSKEIVYCTDAKSKKLTENLKNLNTSYVRFLSKKEEIKEFFNASKAVMVVLIPIIFNKIHYADFVLEFNTDIFKDKYIVEFINSFFNHIGIVFDKSFNFEEKKENLKKLEFILKISKIYSQTKEYHKTFKNLVEIVAEELKADRCFFIVKGDKDELKAVAALGDDRDAIMEKVFTSGNGIVGHVVKTHESIILENALDFEKHEYTKGFKKRKQALISVPVLFKGELVGVLTVSKYGTIPFDDSEFELVKIISNNSSSYVKSLLLQMETENKIEQLSFLYKIFTSIRTILNIHFLKRIVTTTLGSLSKADVSLLLKMEGEHFVITDTYFSNPEYKSCVKFKKYYKNEKLMSLTSTIHLGSDSSLAKSMFTENIKKTTLIPVNVSDKEKYVLMLSYTSAHSEKITDDTYNAIMQELGMKFENAMLFQDNETKIKQYNIISTLAKKLTYIRNIDEYFTYLLSAAIEIVNGSIATLLLREGNNLVFKASYGVELEKIRNIKISMGTGVAGNVAKHGRAAIVNDTAANKYFINIDGLSELYKVYNLINVPLIFMGETIGVLCVDNKKIGDFNENDAQFLETLANTVIVAMEQFMGNRIEKHMSDVILDNIPSGVIYIGRDGGIKHINKAFSRISRYSLKEMADQKYSDFIIDKNKIIQKVIKLEKPVFRSEVDLRTKTGDIVPCGISITPIKIDNILDIVCIVQDLSEIKKIQAELKAKENLAVLGQMAAGMAHEIKNPLAGILTGMEFLKMQIGETDEIYGESIDLVIKEVKRLDRIVNDMTSFAKTKTRIITKTDIKKVLEHAMEIVKGRFKDSNISIDTTIPSDISEIDIDEEQIVEVLINIFINAVQAIEKNGTIKVTVKHINGEMSIKVFNNGPAIGTDIIDKIFNPFFTTKSGGTGLGLAISYNIIKEHNGVLKAVNEDNGVSFIITLPCKNKNE